DSVTAEIGDTVSFRIYYHNTSGVTAANTRVRIIPSVSADGQTVTVTGRLWADDTASVVDTIPITLTGGGEITFLDHIATFWYPNRSQTAQPLPGGQDGSEVATANGLNIGNIAPGWGTTGFVVARFRVWGFLSPPPGDPPTTVTLSATDVSRTGATLRGQVNPNGQFTDAWFEWGKSSSNLDRETPSEFIGSGTDFRDFSSSITGLDSNTTYFYRTAAASELGFVRGEIKSFTTSAQGGSPAINTLSATDIGRNSARFRGEVSPQGDSTRVWFEWGKSSSNLNRETSDQSFSGSGVSEFSSSVSDLDSDTTYYYQAIARNSFGTVRGGIRSFTTNRDGVRDLPSVTTFSATGIDNESARLRGEVNPKGDSTRVWFEWGRSSSNLNRETSDQSIGSDNRFTEFSSSISGLDPNTTYYFRGVARNSFGTVRGEIRSFDTLRSRTTLELSSIRTLPANSITSISANIRGEVNPRGSVTTAFFEWGSNPNNLVNRTGAVSVGSGNNPVNITSLVAGLNFNTTYYYRVVADNNAGRSVSSIESFRTNTFVPVSTSPASVVTPVVTQIVRVLERGAAEAPKEGRATLTLEADTSEVRGGRITYIVSYENLTNTTFRDALIEVQLPRKLNFEDASPSVDEVRDNTLVFELDTVRGKGGGEIEIETSSEDLETGDKITVTASLNYTDSNDTKQIVSVSETTEITEEDLAGGLTATIGDGLKDFFGNPIFWLLAGFAFIYLIYHFLTTRRHPPTYPMAGETTGSPYPSAPPVPLGQDISPTPPVHSTFPQTPSVRAPEGPPFG
ncbi:MAG: fibronectin type III domain-containing protein, partial [Candidatus Colwellbacteria bacterium]|nr:fibronectin type III domain-containing protein [Candidatus Colwellbacteria bacterium]